MTEEQVIEVCGAVRKIVAELEMVSGNGESQIQEAARAAS